MFGKKSVSEENMYINVFKNKMYNLKNAYGTSFLIASLWVQKEEKKHFGGENHTGTQELNPGHFVNAYAETV